MNTRRLGVGVALATAALALSTTSAVAADPASPTAAFAGHLVAGPGATTVKIRYSCSATASPVNHLFVAVKQGAAINDTDHTTSADADTFYSTNWKSDKGPNRLRCDGVQHRQTIVLKPQPGFQAKVRRLHSGPALVQICVYDNVTQFSPDGEPLDGGFAPSYTMQTVHAGKHKHHH
jgi:hypothetical protein